MKSLGSRGYVVLAGTTLSAFVLQQCLALDASSARAETGSIILAQAPAADPNDPRQKGKPKPPAGQPQGTPAPKQPAAIGSGTPKVTNTPVQPSVQPRNVPPGQPAAIGSGTPKPSTPTVQPKITPPVQPSVKPANVQPGQPAALGSGQPKAVAPTGQPKITNTPVQPNVQPKVLQPAVGAKQLQPKAPADQAPSSGQRLIGQPKGAQPVLPIQNVDQLRAQRKAQMVGNQKVLVEPDRRMIVHDGNRAFIRHDENSRFRLLGGKPKIERRGNEQFAYVVRPGGYQIITVTDANGRLLRRMRRGPDGRDVVLINNRRGAGLGVGLGAGLLLGLAAPHVLIPRDQYIVDVSAAEPAMLYDAFDAPPLEALERGYSLDEIRHNVELRDRVRRLDVDSITFASGAWEITPEQYPALEAVAQAMQRILSRNPNAMFLIEGHTDTAGNEDDNLSLSDRRAESVAVVLSQEFQIPPENLVTQGYGQQFLKVPTDGANRSNRRVAVRNIFRLLAGS